MYEIESIFLNHAVVPKFAVMIKTSALLRVWDVLDI